MCTPCTVYTSPCSSSSFAELARVTVSTDDCEQTGINNLRFRLGSGTKLDKFQDLLKICVLFIFMYFSICGAEEFKVTIEKRWRKLRSKPSTADQAWLIPHPNRSAWSDSREFNKVNLGREIVGYKPRINTKNDAKCMDTYLSTVNSYDHKCRRY